MEPSQPRPTSSLRPRHQLSRSISELSSPIRLHRQNQHQHHLLHHSLSRRDRDRDDLPPASAPLSFQFPRASLDVPRSEGLTPSQFSADQSRRTSIMPSGDESTSTPLPRLISREEEMRRAKERLREMTGGLKQSLEELSFSSSAATKRLDGTYYALLEKLSTLQGTIVALKELASMSQQIDGSFRTESRELVSEIESQLNTIGKLDGQQRRIESLDEHIQTGRRKVETLSRRVEVVRERVEGWERADKEWRERTRKRLTVIWIITSIIVFAVILLLVGAKYASMSDEGLPSSTQAARNITVKASHVVPNLTSEADYKKPNITEILAEVARSGPSVGDEIKAAMNRTRNDDRAVNEQVLRVFDEL